MEPFQFDYLGYMKNMIFLVILMAVLAYILVKLKTRDSMSVSGDSKLALGLGNLFSTPTQRQSTSHIEVLEKKTLEPRKNLYLVRIFGEQYWLVGTTDTQIESLGQLKAPGHTPEVLSEQPQEQANAFADYLTQNEVS